MTMTTSVLQDQRQADNLDISKFGPISLVTIQPTSFCNLDCDYCYLPDRHLKKHLSIELIDPIFRQIFLSPFFRSNFNVCWHSGEPLVLPVSFYQQAFAAASTANERYNATEFQFSYAYQTNGTLINQAWCDFFKQHSVYIGVSVDGPAFLHDTHRLTRGRRSTHALTMRGIKYLQDNEIPHSAIAVITQESLKYPEEVFNFFLENQIATVGFNFEETVGSNEKSSLDNEKNEAMLQEFVRRVWVLAKQNADKIKLREFELLARVIYSGERIRYTEVNHPFAAVNIDSSGNFSTFDPEMLPATIHPYGNLILGNVLHDSFESVCQSEKFLWIHRDMQSGIQKCVESCPYFGVCGGGTGGSKYWENGTFNSSQTQACRNRTQIVTDIIVEELEKELAIATV